ncbi:MAG: hypothetical protein K2M46_05310 [Lachnospiraceae bacterium]|nr:hypothetical protein [Lachnospiraceae bacterium]
MTESELREKASAIHAQLSDKTVSNEAIILQIKEIPELVRAKLMSDENLFLESVFSNRFPVAIALSDMGADIHRTFKGSIFKGNALNVVHSPKEAEWLLDHGVKIEKNLLLSQPFLNPAIMAAEHNDTTMLLYWLDKQKEIFADDAEYVQELYYAAIDMVSMMNQYNMLACVIANEELYNILKDIYSKTDDTSSIRLYLNALKYIDDKNLDARKKELRKILNTRKKELSSKA